MPLTPPALVPIADADLLALKDAVRLLIHRGVAEGRFASVRGALVDLGGQYGALRQQGQAHCRATALCRDQVEAWLRDERLELGLRPLGDDALLDLADHAIAIPTEDEGGLLDLGRQARQRYEAGWTWEAARHAAGNWLWSYYDVPNPWPLPSRPAPILTAADRWFQEDGADADYREMSAMALYARVQRGEDLTADLHWWQAHATHLRLFGMLGHPYWQRQGIAYGPADPDFFDQTAALLDRLLGAGLGVRYSVFCDAAHVSGVRTRAEREAHARRMAGLLALRPGVLVEVANEPTMNGFRTDDGELVRLAGIFRSAGCALVALGAHHGSDGHRPDLAVPPATYVSFHAERQTGEDGWAWIRRLGEYPVIANEAGLPALSGEPINAGDEGAPGDYQDDLGIWFAYGALSRLVPTAGYLPCLHSHPGLLGYAPQGRTRQCAEAFLAGCAAVPLHVRRWAWVNGHHTTSPFEGFWQRDPPLDDRPARVYGRGGAGGYLGVAIRAPRSWAWSRLRYPVQRLVEVGDGPFVTAVWSTR